MDHISDDDLAAVPKEVIEKAKKVDIKYNPEDIKEIISSDNMTVDSLTNLAATAYHYLTQEMAREMTEKNVLSDKTRRWFETLTTTLEKLHRAKFGDKAINVNFNNPDFNSIRNFINTGGKVKHE